MGYLDFDRVRYWDHRMSHNFTLKGPDLKLTLQSDWTNRLDTIKHQDGDMAAAQANKDLLENEQRADKKLRDAAIARRKAGGPKIDYSVYPNHPLNSLINK